jgi:hypothetical protein
MANDYNISDEVATENNLDIATAWIQSTVVILRSGVDKNVMRELMDKLMDHIEPEESVWREGIHGNLIKQIYAKDFIKAAVDIKVAMQTYGFPDPSE